MKVFIVCMFDSIHSARWLSQFDDINVRLSIFPSSHFRNLNHELKELISAKRISIARRNRLVPLRLYGYYDTIRFRLIPLFFHFFSREKALRRVFNENEYEILHLLEFQHAGYLFLKADLHETSSQIILTNWGSDIYFFMGDPEHLAKIKLLLSSADMYSAECYRDYELARNLGFKGKLLPMIPNAGGFEVSADFSMILPSRLRTQILFKCNSGPFGLGALQLGVARKLLELHPNFSVHLYSVGEDLLGQAEILKEAFPDAIRITPSTTKLSHKEMLHEFSNSLVYVGASRSDGISTAFLEALVSGCFPIQTNTSCASEWQNRGFSCEVVEPTEDGILSALQRVVFDVERLSRAQKINWELSHKYLQKSLIKSQAQTFYTNELGSA